MRAVFVKEFGLDKPMALDEAPAPAPGAGQLLVRVRAAGVNPLELSIRDGKHPRAKTMRLPYICGTDLAGEVEAVGEGVEGFRPGDKVWGRSNTGAYAEYTLLQPPLLARVPDTLTFGEASALPIPLITAWNALVVKAQAVPGDTVLVQGGAGGVGYMAIQLAHHMGCRVFTTVSSKEKAAFCLAAGAEAAINYREENVVERVMELTGGRGADVVVETVAISNFSADLELYAMNGRIVLVGTGTGKGGDVPFPVRLAMSKDARILGLASGNLGPALPGIMRRMQPLLESGAIKPHVGVELPLEKANESHALLLSGKFLGKVVLTP